MPLRYVTVSRVPWNPNKTASYLTASEAAAKRLLAELHPIGVSADDWKSMRAAAYKALGWVAMQRKIFPEAEAMFLASLQESAGRSADTSAHLGMVIRAQLQSYPPGSDSFYERLQQSVFHLTRAYSHTGIGALNADQRIGLNDFVRKFFERYYIPDARSLAEVSEIAGQTAFPPVGFAIRAVRRPLTDAGGAERTQQK
jgi:hypothetical protein